MYIMVCYQFLYTATWSFKVSSTHNRKPISISYVSYLKHTAKLQNVQNVKFLIRNDLASLVHIVLQVSKALQSHIHVKVIWPWSSSQPTHDPLWVSRNSNWRVKRANVYLACIGKWRHTAVHTRTMWMIKQAPHMFWQYRNLS